MRNQVLTLLIASSATVRVSAFCPVRHRQSSLSATASTNKPPFFVRQPATQLFASIEEDILEEEAQLPESVVGRVAKEEEAEAFVEEAGPFIEKDITVEEDAEAAARSLKEIFPTAQIYIFEMAQYRPLGCTVEESMDVSENYVFVSKVVRGGFADAAGLQVGDVIASVTGNFGGMTSVLESGVEKM
jgi:C-terminal processing protease CtpA/Prc